MSACCPNQTCCNRIFEQTRGLGDPILNMMGIHQAQAEFFSYRVNLEHRVRQDHPLRRVLAVIDFTCVRAEVARFYGRYGNEGVDPIMLTKLMFLLFVEDVPSERELMERLPERLSVPVCPG